MGTPIAFISNLALKLGQLAMEEAKYLDGVDEKLTRLRTELIWMTGFLKDVASMKSRTKVVDAWVAEVRERAYEAEDLIDTFDIKVAAKRHGRLRCLPKEYWWLHKIGTEVDEVTEKISDLTRRAQTYRIEPMQSGESSSSLHRETFPDVIEKDITEIDAYISELVSVLLDKPVRGNRSYEVVVVAGMGGLGKTTIAKEVYRHTQIRCHFNRFSWVYVSQQYQVRDIWQKILLGLESPTRERRDEILKLTDQELAHQLRQKLQEDLCLVVLDDMWTAQVWHSLKAAFPGDGCRSKILITTRNDAIAEHSHGFLQKPKCLDPDQSLRLLRQIVFHPSTAESAEGNEGMKDDHKKKEELAGKMVEHCGGLPLAIKALGGILATKVTLTEWNMVFEHINSQIARSGNQGAENTGVRNILASSYDDLPAHLKSCFTYMALFPEDYEINVEMLIQMWIAEGMVEHTQVHWEEKEDELEDIAKSYLSGLIKRSMVLVGEKDELGDILATCRLHDLMRDLCLSKAKEEDMLLIPNRSVQVDDSSVLFMPTIGKVRRIAIHEPRQIRYFYSNPYLRSLWFFCDISSKEELGRVDGCFLLFAQYWKNYCKSRRFWVFVTSNYKLLRVLNLQGVKLRSSLNEIGELVYLKMLVLGYVGKKLSSSLGKLSCLQTLCFGGNWFYYRSGPLPDVLWKLEQLRYLSLRSWHPYRIGKWRNMRKLMGIGLNRHNVKSLGALTQLRELLVWLMKDDVSQDQDLVTAFSDALKNMRHLCCLSISQRPGYCIDASPVLEALQQGCPNFYKLVINSSMHKLPEIFPSTISHLKLKGCYLSEDPMLTLQRLPNLRYLSLDLSSFTGNKMECSATGFPKLDSLHLECLKELEELIIHKGALSKLRRMKISYCRKLKTAPDGLRFIRSLQELEIEGKPKEFCNRLVPGGADYEKVQHIPSVTFH